MILNSPYISGSLTVTGNIITSGSITISGSIASASYAVSASEASKLQGLGSASFAPASTFNTVSQSYAASSASLSTRVTNEEATSSVLTSASSSFAIMSGSLSTRVTNLESTSSTVSSSFATTSGSISSRVTLVEGQDATTGSNVFTGTQYVSEASNAISFTSTASLYTDGGFRVAKDSFISGTAYFNNITVYGTSSIEYITSSQVNIGSNIITVNTDTPAVRFGGLSVFDSGSTGLTGSIFWDSEKNHWIYSNPSGSSYNSGMIMSGPRNSGSLGDEQGTTFNALMKGQGGDHITSSQMIDDGTTVRIPGNLQVTGSLSGSSAVFSGTVIASNGTLAGGTGTTNYLPKFTGASTIGNSAIYDNGGNIGIGITNAVVNLQINGSAEVYSALSVGGTRYMQFGADATANYINSYNGVPLIFSTSATTSFSQKMILTSSGNLGLGVTPSAWSTIVPMQILNTSYGASPNNLISYMSSNVFFDGAFKYITTGTATQYRMNDSGTFSWLQAPSGTAGNPITFTTALTIASTGAATFSSSVTASGGKPQLYVVGNASAGAGVILNTGLSGTDRRNWFIGTEENVAGDFTIKCSTAAGGNANAGDTRLAILNNGNVGIGTNSPTNKLHIVGTGGNTQTLVLEGTPSVANAYIVFKSASKTYFSGLSSDQANNYIFYDGTADTTRMCITTNGNVLIGKTSDSASAETVKGLQLTQTARILCTMDGTYSAFSRLSDDGDVITFHRGQVSKVGSISVTTTATNYTSGPSDIRLKKNFEDWNENVLTLFKDISPILYHLTYQNDNDTKIKGFIAQEMFNKFPEAYPVDDKGFYYFNPSGMTIYLMKAIQEQQAQIQALKARIETLEK